MRKLSKSSWVLCEIYCFCGPSKKISIIPRTKCPLGFSQYLKNDGKIMTKHEISNQVKFFLGGRLAEILFFGFASTAAEDDLKKAFNLVSKMVCDFGMTDRYKVFIF